MALSAIRKRIEKGTRNLWGKGGPRVRSLFSGGVKNVSAVGLDLGSHRIRAVVLSTSRGTPVVEQLLETAVPPAMLSPDTIIDPEGLAEEVAHMFMRGGVRRPRATIMVGGSDVFIRRVSMPRLSHQEAMHQLPQNPNLGIPFDPENNKFEISILDPDSNANTMQVVVVAAKKDSIMARQQVVIGSGALLHAVDVDAFALFNVFEHCHKDLMHERLTLVDIGYERSLVVVIDRQTLSVARHAYIGVAHLIEQLRSSSLVPEEAERVLRSPSPPIIYGDVFSTWGGQLLEEVRRSAGGGRGEASTGKIYLSGSGAEIDGLATFLSERGRTPVAIFNPLNSMMKGSAVRERGERAGASFTLAIGLGLRQVL